MKNAYFQNIISIIKKNIISYIAIMMFVFFSMHMYLLVAYLIDSIYLNADKCYENYKKYDVAAYIENGIDDGLKEDILNIEGTDKVETVHISYGFLEINNEKFDTEVRTLSEDMALPVDIEGKLPTKINEIALLNHFAKDYNIRIGDTITLKDNPYLQEEKFIVTTTFESSQFLSKLESSYGVSKNTGNVFTCEVFVNKNALNNNYINDNYIMMRNNSLKGISRFSDEYNNLCTDYIEKIDNSLDILVNGKYYIERWEEEVGYTIINIFIHTTKTIHKTIVPVLFFVAIAVLIISITRMTMDQKNEIGIMKANGFTNKEIAMIFYAYSVSATIIGSILANIVASFFTVRLVYSIVVSHVVLMPDNIVFKMEGIMFTIIVPTIIIIVTTHIFIKNILKKNAIDILNEKKVNSSKVFFYEYLIIFKKLPIFIQMIINNMLKNIRGNVGIILSVIGSVMLLVSGIMLNRNVYNGFKHQINNDIRFDTLLIFNPLSGANDEIEKILKDNNVDYALCQYTDLTLKNKNNKLNTFSLFVYDDKNDFSKLFKFNTLEKNRHTYKGLFLQESYKNHFELDEHGYIKVKDSKGDYKYVRTAQYFYNYIEAISFAAIDRETYEKIMDTESYMQAYIIDTTKVSMKSINNELSNVDGYLYAMEYKKYLKDGFMSIYDFINMVVGIFIITSIIFSFLIVLNLMKVNILERKNELIILSINGFTKKEIKRYVLTDMILLLVVGNAMGVVFGIIVGAFVLVNFNNEIISYMNKINYSAIYISLIISSLICFIITKLSIKEIDMININNMDES